MSARADFQPHMIGRMAGRTWFLPWRQPAHLWCRPFRLTLDSGLAAIGIGLAHGALRMNAGGRITDLATDGTVFPRFGQIQRLRPSCVGSHCRHRN